MSKRYIVQYDHHHDRYGVYDRTERAVAWIGDDAAAQSEATRRNAVEEVGAALNTAIVAITTVCNGSLSPDRRAAYQSLRKQLRVERDALPDVAQLMAEVARAQSPVMP